MESNLQQSERPLFRWTLGNPSNLGMNIFEESIHITTRALGINNFEWTVCYNNLNEEQLERVNHIIQGTPIKLLQASPNTCPIALQHNLRSLWKVCPPRLRIKSHEIIMDNDIVICKKPPEIDEFLKGAKVLCMGDQIRWLGRYGAFYPANKSFNSGLIGLPPNYDFAGRLNDVWSRHGKCENLNYADEQGLIALTLESEPKIVMDRDTFKEYWPDKSIHKSASAPRFGFHFVVSNRTEYHLGWNYYRDLKTRSVKIL